MRGRGGEVQSQQMHCETGLLDVEGEMENLSAKVVNLFLASFSEERKKKKGRRSSEETPCVSLLSPDVDPEDMAQNGKIRCHECSL